MPQRTPKICQPYGKVVIPIEDGECLYWLIPVDSVEDIENPTRDFAWITPDGVFYVFDGKKIVPINDPNTLKVQFQNVLGDPYDNGNLATALNEKVNGIRMNDRTVPMGTNGIVDLGCITTCEDLEQAIAGIDTMHAEIVEELPETGDEQTIYLIPKELEPEYVLPCHEYLFTQKGDTYETNWITPNNALPIVNGQTYTFTIGDTDYTGVGSVSGDRYSIEITEGSIISIPGLPSTTGEEWNLTIILNSLPESAEEVEGGYNVNVCVSKLQDTVYEMYLWIDGEYRFIGAKPISVDTDKDWNVNNPNSVEYIKNRTHYTDDNGTVHTLDDKYLSGNIARTSDLPQYQSVTARATKTLNNITPYNTDYSYIDIPFTIPEGYRYHATRALHIVRKSGSTLTVGYLTGFGFDYTVGTNIFRVHFVAMNDSAQAISGVVFEADATLEFVKD